MNTSASDVVHPRPRRTSGPMWLQKYALLIIAAAVFVSFSIALTDTYASVSNMRAMFSTQSVSLILTLAVIFPLRTGEFDLSVAANMVLCSTVLGKLTVSLGVPPLLAVVMTLATGLLVGAVNALFTVRLGIDAFIVTLGSMTLLQGLSTGLTGGSLIIGLPDSLLAVARTDIIGLPSAVWLGWVLAAVVWYVLNWTPFGRYLLFVGGNRQAAVFSGVPVRRTRVTAFVVAGLLSAIAGILLAGKLGSVDPTVGPSFLLPPYAAAFLGTTVIQIGRFNVVGALVGTYLLIFGITGLLLMGAAPWVSDVFNGGALIIAVTFAQLTRRRQTTPQSSRRRIQTKVSQ